MTEKRLPQVGEIWWDGRMRIIGPLELNDSKKYPLICNGTGLTYTNDGIWCVSSPNLEDNLLHIHTDATGKVINPTFPGDDMKKKTQAPVDPFTIDWPKSAFNVGDKVMLKPDYMERKDAHTRQWWLYDKNDAQRKAIDTSEVFHIVYLLDDEHDLHVSYGCRTHHKLLVPFSEVEKCRAAISGQKPPKPPKPDPITQALEASRERVKDLEALQELTAKARANKAEAKELAAKIKGLKEKVGMK